MTAALPNESVKRKGYAVPFEDEASALSLEAVMSSVKAVVSMMSVTAEVSRLAVTIDAQEAVHSKTQAAQAKARNFFMFKGYSFSPHPPSVGKEKNILIGRSPGS